MQESGNTRYWEEGTPLFPQRGSAAPPQPKRSPHPGFFALFVRQAARQARLVVSLWLVAALAGLVLAVAMRPLDTGRKIAWAGNPTHTERLATLDASFPGISGLVTLTLSGGSPAEREGAAVNILQSLESRSHHFRVVFSPGLGPYYEKYAMLYLPPEEIVRRVHNTRVLRPLFEAIAAEPSLEGMTLLVNEVAAAIQQGRKPQGLERLFKHAADTIRSQFQGSALPMDWRSIADLALPQAGGEVKIVAWPQTGEEQQASAAIRAVIAGFRPEITPVAVSTQGLQAQPAEEARHDLPQILVGLCLAVVFLAAATLFLFGELRLAAMVLLPAAVTPLVLCGGLSLAWPAPGETVLAVLAAGLVSALALAAPFAAGIVQAENGDVFHMRTLMIAARRLGPRLTAVCLGIMSLWASWLLAGNALYSSLALTAAAGALLSWLVTFTLVPALASLLRGKGHWQSESWLGESHGLPAYFRGYPEIRTGIAAVLVAAGLSGLPLLASMPVATRAKAGGDDGKVIQLIAGNEKHARDVIARLKPVPEVLSLRWLGAFLPEGAQEKVDLLKPLAGSLPRAKPRELYRMDASAASRIEDLEESLKTIASAANTPDDLRSAAHAFRRSVSLLAATGANIELAAVQLETLLFGRFDEAASTADRLADLKPPGLADVDPRVRDMFLTADGSLRLEVIPAPGITSLDLARRLEAMGLTPVNGGLADEAAAAGVRSVFGLVSAVGLAIALLLCLLHTRQVAPWLARSASMMASFVLVLEGVSLARQSLSLLALPMLTVAAAAGLAMAFWPRQSFRYAALGPYAGIERAGVASLMAVPICLALPAILLGSVYTSELVVLSGAMLAVWAVIVAVETPLARGLRQMRQRLMRDPPEWTPARR
jgi:hypothetical protein